MMKYGMIMSRQSQSTYEVTYPPEVVSIGKNRGSDDHISVHYRAQTQRPKLSLVVTIGNDVLFWKMKR